MSLLRKKMSDLSIRSKLALLGIGTVFILALAMIAVGVWQGNVFSSKARVEAEKLIDVDLNHITEGVYNNIKAQDESIQQKVNHDLNVAGYVLNRAGGVSLMNETTIWNAVNQFTGKYQTVPLPKMAVGKTWLGHNNKLFVETPVVDTVKRLVGGTATIFQRMNGQGDILRVATNVENSDGTRAIGTYIPAVNPDGQPNPVVATVMRGETYRGLAYVVNAWYVTAYEPIVDGNGSIIGVLYVGVKQENIESLRQAIMQVRIGKTGYVFVLGGKGNNRGKYIISKGGERDGTDIWDEKDAKGNLVIQSIVTRALNLKPTEFATERYLWRNPDETEPRWKIARLAYYEPWDWVIGASVYEDELQKSLSVITAGYMKMVFGFSILALCVAGLGGLFTWLYASHITGPLTAVTGEATRLTKKEFPRLVNTMQSVEQGDLTVSFHFETQSIDILSEDEIGMMARAFNSMNGVLESVGKSFTQMVANLRELTNRLEERVEERTADLRESESKLSDIVSFLPDATLVIDRTGKVLAWNRALEALTGIKAEVMIGKGGYEYALPFYGERRPLLVDLALTQVAELDNPAYANLRRAGEALIGEVHAPSLPGGARYLLETARPLYDSKGAVDGAIEILHDITARRLSEEELKKAKEVAESANQAKSTFLAMMSHEIRTPLNGILGMSDLMLATELNGKQREFTRTIRESGEALLTIINDILDFSKIEAGRLDIEHRPFILMDCVESALDVVAAKASEKGLDLIYHIEARTPAGIISDPSRIRQIILNLLSNAVKFSEQGEVLLNVSARKSAGADPEEYELHFSVRDTGIGIPADRMNRLFKSFSQVDVSMARKYGGTGLGLAISKRLAELLGGTIWVESEEGKGSTFHFTICAKEAKGLKPSYLRDDSEHLRGKGALVVDDNPTNRKILGLQLESWGMVSTAVESGERALSLLRSGRSFDVVILDMQMPEMTGADVAVAARRLLGEKTPPLLMLSSVGHAEMEVQEECLFAAFLEKPTKASHLYNALTEIVAAGLTKRIGVGGLRVVHDDIDPEMAAKLPLRILIAEDNPTNQRLALLTLERLGYGADVVVNGIEVLKALKHAVYDVILMDVQMPELDGLQTTRKIRSDTQIGLQPHIVALTANAMPSDQEECHDAGMDDYVSKPFNAVELAAALKRYQPHQAPDTEAAASGDARAATGQAVFPESPTEAVLNPAALKRLKETLGKKAAAMLPVLTEVLLKDADLLLDAAGKALEDKDADELRRAAHTLKSNFRNFGADRLADTCQELELIAKQADVEQAVPVFRQLQAQYPAVRDALQALRGLG